MKRREFLKSTATYSVLSAALTMDAAENTSPSGREFYDLRLYHLRKGITPKLFDDYFREAALPALQRLGVGPVGIFNVLIGPDSPTIYVLIPHPSMESFLTTREGLAADATFQKAGAPFLDVKANEPAYIRMESSWLRATQGVPKIEVPAATFGNKPRIFELRTYESHSEKASGAKIEMFNKSELRIFRRTGLQPVFFGETLVGPKMPNLTYLLTFESLAAREKNWATFAADPEWKLLSATPGFTDSEIVTNTSNVILRPTACSQI